mgnify:CR=1 FL=1
MLFENTTQHEKMLLAGIIAASVAIIVALFSVVQLLLVQQHSRVVEVEVEVEPVQVNEFEDVELTPEEHAAFIEELEAQNDNIQANSQDLSQEEHTAFIKKLEAQNDPDEEGEVMSPEQRAEFLKKLDSY